LASGHLAGGEQRGYLSQGGGKNSDAFIIFEVLCGRCEGRGDEGVHEFVGQARGGVETAERLEMACDEAGFLGEFAGGAQGRVFPGSSGARGQFDHPLFVGEPPVLDQDEVGLAAGGVPDGGDDHRAGVADALAGDGGPCVSREGQPLEVELAAFVQ
jgi:hypothetical protein